LRARTYASCNSHHAMPCNAMLRYAHEPTKKRPKLSKTPRFQDSITDETMTIQVIFFSSLHSQTANINAGKLLQVIPLSPLSLFGFVKKRYVIDGSLKRIIRNKEEKVFPVCQEKKGKTIENNGMKNPKQRFCFVSPLFFARNSSSSISSPTVESLQQRLLSTSHNPVHHRWVGPASR